MVAVPPRPQNVAHQLPQLVMTPRSLCVDKHLAGPRFPERLDILSRSLDGKMHVEEDAGMPATQA